MPIKTKGSCAVITELITGQAKEEECLSQLKDYHSISITACIFNKPITAVVLMSQAGNGHARVVKVLKTSTPIKIWLSNYKVL